jgi:hypothetical protein
MTKKPENTTHHDLETKELSRIVPRKKAYRESIGISDPTIWRWTRAGKLSSADAVINGREYSRPETIQADVDRLLKEHSIN